MSSDRDADSTPTATEAETDTEARDRGADGDRPAGESAGERSSEREIDVPIRLYKTVTVVSTLVAVVCVILGFVLLDAATLRMSALRRLLAGALAALGAEPSGDTLAGVLAALGLASIAFGAGVYVFGTRFRPRGMGNSQEDSDEASDNG